MRDILPRSIWLLHLQPPEFDNLLGAQVLIEDWRIDHIQRRLHSAHG